MGKHKQQRHHHHHHHRHGDGDGSATCGHRASKYPDSILATIYHKGDVYSNVKMSLENDLANKEGLIRKTSEIIGRVVVNQQGDNEKKDGLATDTNTVMAVYRYSKSKDAYVLMDDEEEFATVKRSLTVKHRLCFYVKELAAGSKPKSRLSPSKSQPPPHDRDHRRSKKCSKTECYTVSGSAAGPMQSKCSVKSISDATVGQQGQQGQQGPQGLVDISQFMDFSEKFIENLESLIEHTGQNVVKTIKSEIFNAVRGWCEPEDEQNAKVTASMFEVEGLVGSSNGPLFSNPVSTASSSAPIHFGQRTALQSHNVQTEADPKAEHKALCDKCDKKIIGRRYKCLTCADFDYCQDCIGLGLAEHGHSFACLHSHNDYLIPRRFRYACDGPNCSGRSFKSDWLQCNVCSNFDLCQGCSLSPQLNHDTTHTFSLIRKDRIPIPIGTLGNWRGMSQQTVESVHERKKETGDVVNSAPSQGNVEAVEILNVDFMRNNIYLTMQNKTNNMLKMGWFVGQLLGKSIVLCRSGIVAPNSVATFEVHYSHEQTIDEAIAKEFVAGLKFQTKTQDYNVKTNTPLALRIWDCSSTCKVVEDDMAELTVANTGNCTWPSEIVLGQSTFKYTSSNVGVDGNSDEDIRPNMSLTYRIPLEHIYDTWAALIVDDHKLFFQTDLPVANPFGVEDEGENQSQEEEEEDDDDEEEEEQEEEEEEEKETVVPAPKEEVTEESAQDVSPTPLTLSGSGVRFPRLPTESPESSNYIVPEEVKKEDEAKEEHADELSSHASEGYWESDYAGVNDALSSHESDYEVVDGTSDMTEGEEDYEEIGDEESFF